MAIVHNSIWQTRFNPNNATEKASALCKTLKRNPYIGAVIQLYPVVKEGAPFEYVRVTYLPRTSSFKFCLLEYKLQEHATFICKYEKDGLVVTDFDLVDLEFWFRRIHTGGFEAILELIPLIYSHNLALWDKEIKEVSLIKSNLVLGPV